MSRKQLSIVAATMVPVALSLAVLGCATAFSPAMIRNQIASQTGQDPLGVFELSLGRSTMALARAVLASASPEGPLPLGGVAAFELAVYKVPGSGGDLDFTRMPFRGWEPVIKFREGPRSAFVLVRARTEVIGDLVVVAGGVERVVYARIRGHLSPDLPEALGRAVRNEGPEAIRKGLLSLTEQPR